VVVTTNRDVLISGASVAGPTLAYWLHRHGFRPTVVERAPVLRAGLGGHAVDVFGPAVDVAEWMGVLPAVMAARTRIEQLSFIRPGRPPVDVDMRRLVATISDRHVEIMRGELASILHEATRDDVEYVFGDSIEALTSTDDGVKVTFEHGPPRTFDLVVGADGLHSVVRRLTFGDESRYRRWIGGYLAVYTVPNHLQLSGRMLTYLAPGRLAGVYPVRQTGEARATFLFRRAEEFTYDHRDIGRQRMLLRETYANDGWEVPRLLAELDGAEDFYLDSISQIVMDAWSRGRVTLVGDAGYSPGPAVGGGTSAAVVGAYLLAGELREADGDHRTAFAAYERAMGELVRRSRAMGGSMMGTLIPRTSRQAWLTPYAVRLLPRLPARIQRRLLSLQGGPARVLGTVALKRYG
jgi:2-polyprenyl-6-methoxyphenol hydroxylase-like FAD-dependent oxidoreductase